jgi:hypothetical protein
MSPNEPADTALRSDEFQALQPYRKADKLSAGKPTVSNMTEWVAELGGRIRAMVLLAQSRSQEDSKNLCTLHADSKSQRRSSINETNGGVADGLWASGLTARITVKGSPLEPIGDFKVHGKM